VSALTVADPWWLLAAVLAEWVSMAAFARQRLWLLHGLGVPATMRKALAVEHHGRHDGGAVGGDVRDRRTADPAADG
jgi:hypothetical protein